METLEHKHCALDERDSVFSGSEVNLISVDAKSTNTEASSSTNGDSHLAESIVPEALKIVGCTSTEQGGKAFEDTGIPVDIGDQSHPVKTEESLNSSVENLTNDTNLAEAEVTNSATADCSEIAGSAHASRSSLFSSDQSSVLASSDNKTNTPDEANISEFVSDSATCTQPDEEPSIEQMSSPPIYHATKVNLEDFQSVENEEPLPKRMKMEDSDTISEKSYPVACPFDFKRCPRQLTGAWTEYASQDNSNYLRGCKWSPDGTCLLTNSNDNVLRLYNLPQELYEEGGENQAIPEMTSVLKMKEADAIYDFCWLPTMSSSDPDTSCLVVTSRGTPVHMYDAYTGFLRCSYRAYDQMDELVAAHCVSFDPQGQRLYCGFNKMVRVFDVTRPGREFVSRPTFAKLGQRGIISCISHSPTDVGLYAAGSYSKSIALYHEPMGEMVCMFEGQQGGVTQVFFSSDGSKLYSGGRKDNEILCWDIRNPGQLLYSLIRKVSTNQRMQFDITQDGRYVVSGCQDGQVLVWDTCQPPIQMAPDIDPILRPVVSFSAHLDTVNGVSLHPTLPIIATASGQRHFPSCFLDSDGEGEEEEKIENSLLLWWV